MNNKLLVLCDELPGEHEGYTVKDFRYFKQIYIDPAEDSDRIFMCWDSLIPEDRAFINALMYYVRLTEFPEPGFVLDQRGATDPASGTIRGSIQEESYLNTYNGIVTRALQLAKAGEDPTGEVLDYAVQYPFLANSRFFEYFSKLLNDKCVIRILPTFSNKSERNITFYRAKMLEAWQAQNQFMDEKAAAKVLPTICYDSIDEVLEKSGDELLKIYSLPLWGEPEQVPPAK